MLSERSSCCCRWGVQDDTITIDTRHNGAGQASLRSHGRVDIVGQVAQTAR